MKKFRFYIRLFILLGTVLTVALSCANKTKKHRHQQSTSSGGLRPMGDTTDEVITDSMRIYVPGKPNTKEASEYKQQVNERKQQINK